MDSHQVFNSTFTALINEDYSIGDDIDRYQSLLDHTLSKVDFSISTGICMVPSNLNLNIGKTARYENKIFISNTGMKSDANKDINKSDFYYKQLPVTKP